MAGNQGAIDDVVRESALKQLDDLTAKANAAEAQIVSLTKAAIELNGATGNSRSFREYNNNAAKAATETAKLQKAQQDLARATILLQQAEQRLAAMTNQTAISQQNLERATLRNTQAQDRAAQSAAKALTPYQQLVNIHRALTEEARNAAIQFGLNSTQYLQAANQANGVGERLNTINNSLGNYSNNVGNYTRGIADYFQRFYSGIRIAAYIIPGLGISGIFLLAFEGIKYVVEQLGLFNDKVSQAEINLKAFNEVSKEANQEAGKQTSNLRILYQAATDVNNSMHDRVLAARELQKEFPDTFRNVKIETILNGNASDSYNQLTKDIQANARARAVANKLGAIEAEIFDSETKQQKIRNAQSNEAARSIDYYTKSLMSRNKALSEAQARAIASKASGFDPNAIGGQVAKGGEGINNELDAINDRAKKALEIESNRQKTLKAERDFLNQFAGGNNAIAKGISQNDTPKDKEPKNTQAEDLRLALKAIKDADDEIQKNENSTYEQRIASAEKFQKDSDDLINKALSNKVLRTNEANSELKDVDKQYNADILKINQDAQKELKALYDKQVADAKLTQEAIVKNSLDVVSQYQNQIKDDAQHSSDEQLQILADQYAKGLINAQEYQEKKRQIEAGGKTNIDESVIQGLEVEKSVRIQLGLDTAEVENKLAEAKRKRDKDVADNAIAQAEREAARKKELAQAEKQLGDELLNFGKTLVDARYQNELNGIQNQKDALTDRTKIEIDAENRSLDSAATKADKIAVINAKAQAQQDVLDAKARQTKQRQAEADRIFAIAKIIENIAIGVSSALAEFPPNIPLAIIVGALGAAQIANVLATPIPKYQSGTDNAKGGLSIVGEAGREYVLPPHGDGFFTPDSASFMDIPKGSKVIPHHELFALMANPNKPPFTPKDRSDRRMIEALNKGNDRLVKALRASKGKKPVVSGWLNEMSKANNFANHRNNHFR